MNQRDQELHLKLGEHDHAFACDRGEPSALRPVDENAKLFSGASQPTRAPVPRDIVLSTRTAVAAAA